VFPDLKIRLEYFRRDRLRELTGFSVYFAVIDWAGRLTYTTDTFILGVFLNTTAVAVYAVAQRLSEALLRMTNQLHTLLFPAIVHQSVDGDPEAQRRILVTATRFQVAVAVALCGSVAADADVLIRAWVGPGFDTAATVLRALALVVVLRTLTAVPGTLLKGTGHHKAVAVASSWCAVANLLLSIAAVNLFGIVGVACATVLPAAALAGSFIFPRACRVVGLPTTEGYRRIVWPVMWPAAIVITLMASTRHLIPVTDAGMPNVAMLSVVLPHMAAGALLYAGLFYMFGLDREERRWFSSAVTHVWRRSLATA
jgi:O-antigen/teichoic acid export membrane protein